MWDVQRARRRELVWLLIATSTSACAQGVEVPSLDGWGSEWTQDREDAGSEEDSETIVGGEEEEEDEEAGALPPFDAAPPSTPAAGGSSAGTVADASVASDAGMSVAIDAASADASPPAPCTSCALKVQWNTRSVESTTQAIQGSLKLLNTGSTPISLAGVSVRYWLREAMAETIVFECYHWDDGRGVNRCVRTSATSVNSFTTLTARGVAADAGLQYLELTFPAAAGELAVAGTSPGAMQIAFHMPSYTPMTQTDDPSFDPLLTSSNMDTLFDAPKITAYVAGQLVWGNEPTP